MLGHASAVLTLDTYADLFPDDLDQVSAAPYAAGSMSLESAAANCGLNSKKALNRFPGQGLSPAFPTSRGGGI